MAESLTVRVAKLGTRMDIVEAAVTNFRSLDKNVNEFMIEFRTHRHDQEVFHNQRDEEIKTAARSAAERIKAELDKSNMYIKRWMMLIAALACVASIVDIIIHYHVL